MNANRWFFLLPFIVLACAFLTAAARADDAARLKELRAQASKLANDGKPKEAIPVYERALTLAKSTLGESHQDTATVMNNLASLFDNIGQPEKALPLYQQALAVYEAKLGKDHPYTATTLNNLADLYRATGQYAKAQPLYHRSLAIREAKLGKDHPDTAITLNNMAVLYHEMGLYAQAESFYQRSLAVKESKLGKDHPHTALALDNLARVYQAMGQYSKAVSLMQRSLAIREVKLGKDHPDTATSLDGLASLYRVMGQYAQAEPLILRSLSIREGKFGKDHIETSIAINNLAVLYFDMHQYAKAEPLYQRSLAIKELKLGKDHPDTATALANLATLYRSQGLYAEAEPLFKRSLAIREARLGLNHPETAATLNYLAILYYATGQYAKAEPLYHRSLVIKESTLGKDHPDIAAELNNLALLYQVMGQYAKAEPFFSRAIDIRRARLGKDHPFTAQTIGNHAFLMAAQARTGDAVRALDRSLRTLRKHSVEVLPILAEDEQLAFLKTTFDLYFKQGLALSLTANLGEDYRQRIASWLLNGKAIAAESLAERTITARDADTAEARKTLAELDDIRRQMAQFTRKRDNPADLKAVEELQQKERHLSASLSSYDGRTKRDDPWFEHDELRQRLPDTTVLIDVARFPIRDFKANKNGKDHFVAFLTFRSTETQIVDLGEADPIDAAVKAARKELEQSAKSIQSKGEPAAEKALREPLAALAKLVLDPLQKHIGDKPHWIVSPDSSLWLVPWAILPLDGAYAVEKHRIQYVVSGRDLLVNPLKLDRKTSTSVVFADPDFDLGLGEATRPEFHRGLSKDFKLGRIGRLPGTAIEAEAILSQLEKLTAEKPNVFTDVQAVASRVRAVKSPRILVLCTHGFFLEDEKVAPQNGKGELDRGSVGPVGENPLLRCGLLLAGCNNATRTKPGGDTGVLTGLEIVSTDLRGTQMVVLSACETGLGDVRNGEGVAGLRQAFQLAGAESVVATLWQVPDRDSALLMASFFDKLAGKQSRDAALAEAQRDMIAKRRDRFAAAHPYFWAAYTLTGQAR